MFSRPLWRNNWLALVIAFAPAGAADGPAPAERVQFAMGTHLRIAPCTPAPAEVFRKIFAEVHRLDAMLSTYRAESAVSMINRRADEDGGWHEIPPLLHDLLRECRRLSDLSDGAFDPTVHALVEAWGFEKNSPRVPLKKELRAALAGVGMGKVVVETGPSGVRVRFLNPATKLNFGAIGKGFAMDRVASILKAYGVPCGFIEFGRSFLVWGMPHTAAPMQVSVVHPEDSARTIVTIALHQQGAVATASQSEQSFQVGKKRYGHILDPRTGRPARNGMLSATATARTAAEADALSTALFVLGFKQSRKLLDTLADAEAVLVHRTAPGSEIKVYVTPGLRKNTILSEDHHHALAPRPSRADA